MRFILALLASTALAPAAWAEQPPSHAADPHKPVVVPADPHEPVPGPGDPRMRSFAADPGNILRATSTGLTPLRFVFDSGELPIAITGPLVNKDPSKATEWFATDAENTVVLQPLHGAMPVSFVFITTALDGQPYNYTIELHTRDGDIANPNDPSAYVQVTFTHPKSPEAAAKAQQAARAAQQTSVINTRLTQARYDAPRNWHYSKRGAGCDRLTPAARNWVSDDGHQTTMLFPGHMKPPVVNTTDDQGEPKLITQTPISHRVGTLYVLPSTYDTFDLRRGTLVCQLRNDRYDDTGTVTGGGSGTISPEVLLRVRQTKGVAH